MMDACQALEKGMGGFGATVKHVMDKVEKERTCAMQVKKGQQKRSQIMPEETVVINCPASKCINRVHVD